MAETRKHNLKFAETERVLYFRKLRKAGKAEKDINEKLWEPENQKKKPRKAGKGRYFLRKPVSRPPITPQAL